MQMCPHSTYEDSEPFSFSVIVPIFNMEDYLNECIDSILNQSIGFEDHIQLILIDDGSTDNSLAICNDYQSDHPRNIIVIENDHGGVSLARNSGLQYAKGAYVTFLDADDKWSVDAFECAYDFFQNNPSISMVSTRHSFFDRKTGDHPLSYKYDTDRIIDITLEIDSPQLSFSDVFIKRELIPESPFDPNLVISEDFLLVNTILMSEKRYGVLHDPIYWYRKRSDTSSATDSSTQSSKWYFDTPQYCYQALLDKAQKVPDVLPYIEYCVMYDLQWRIKQSKFDILDNSELNQYRALLVSLLSQIDDSIIVSQRNLTREEKLLALGAKYGYTFQEAQDRLQVIGTDIYFKPPSHSKVKLSTVDGEQSLRIDFISSMPDGSLEVEGRCSTILPLQDTKLIVRNSEVDAPAILYTQPFGAKNSTLEKDYFHTICFKAHLRDGESRLLMVLQGHAVYPECKGGKFCPLSFLASSYVRFGGNILTYPKRGQFNLQRRGLGWVIKRELLYEAKLWLTKKGARKVLSMRREAFLRTLLPRKKQTWLFSDRSILAGDNGEALFSFLQSHPVDHIKSYFVLRSDSPDWKRMKSIGRVIPFGSKRHKKMCLSADCILSSAAEDNVFNAFGGSETYVKDLKHSKFIFLQHGVIANNMSDWLNRRNKNISLFITSSERERDSIIQEPRYEYDDKIIVCTGLARHDKLLSGTKAPEKKILIAPTWRSNLAATLDQTTGKREANPHFESSDYYIFWNSLINDQALINAAKSRGFSIVFLVHPAFAQERDKFHSDYCEILDEYNYSEMFLSSAIMVTDYSSIHFDFALLEKPIIYIQFDKDEFFASQTYDPGYFNYETDCFGPVCHTKDESIKQIVYAMDNPNMRSEYRNKVHSFFFMPTNSRCQTILDQVVSLS